MRNSEKSVPALRGLENFPEAAGPFLYRATVLNPRSDVECDLYDDGGIAVSGRRIVEMGNFDRLNKLLQARYERIDETEGGERPVVVPGFVDAHAHWVQNEVKGLFNRNLMEWLEQHIWPEEEKYGNPTLARVRAEKFFKELMQQGTIAAALYSSIHEVALTTAFREAVGRMIIGNVVMTQNSPPELLQSRVPALMLVRDSAKEYGPSYAFTPRFPPTCSSSVMAAGAHMAKLHNAWMQSHLAEDAVLEMPFVQKLFPEARDYTDIYARAKMLGPRTILGHGIHLSDTELRILAETQTVIAHCPTSNEALGSGRMPLEKYREFGVRWGLGSDIGAGPSLSMLHVMQGFLEKHKGKCDVTPIEALYRATRAGAEALGLAGICGGLERPHEASFVVLKRPGSGEYTDPNTLLSEILSGTKEELERAVKKTFLAGRVAYAA